MHTSPLCPTAARLLLIAATVLVLGALVFSPAPAHAHGGQFMPPPEDDDPPPPPPPPEPPPPPPPPITPGDGVPPGVIPPPPPGGGPGPSPVPQPGPGPGPDPTPQPQPQPQPGPVTPPAGTPPPGAENGSPTSRREPFRDPIRGRRARLGSDPGSLWQTWWSLNRLGLLPDRTAGLDHAVITPSDGEQPSLDDRWRERRVLVAKRHVAPLLRRLAATGTSARREVVASAILALAKSSHAPEDIALLTRHLGDRRSPDVVRESAALAIGLLARSNESLRLDGTTLDRLRERLLVTFDDGHTPLRVRAFCTLSLGLLGDQPYGGPYSKDGRLVTRALWMRLETCEEHRGLKVALLTALGMQPSSGVPSAVREGLQRILVGRRALRRTWDPTERSHALTALLRLGGPDGHATLVRTVARTREHVAVRRAAYVAIGELAETFTANEREETAEVLLVALKKRRDPLTTGLGHLALGHLLGADLRHGDLDVFQTGAPRKLLKESENGATPTRGFSTIALGLALRNVSTSTPEVGTFLGKAGRVLLRGLEGGRGDDRMRGSYAVAVGIAGTQNALPILQAVVSDDHADPELRGHAAVSLGQLGRNTPEVQRVLFGAVAQRRSAELRRQGALGLAFLGNRVVGPQLLRELDQGKTEQLLAQIVLALGRLGDLKAVAPLVTYAVDDRRSELSQALAVVALGMLADPEPRPTLLRLTQHANYPARTDALHEAFSIL